MDEVIKPMIIERWIKPLENYENPLDGILAQMKILIGDSDPAHLKLGYIKNNVNTREVAHFVVMAHEGFYGMLKGLDKPPIFAALYQSMKRYFKIISSSPTY